MKTLQYYNPVRVFFGLGARHMVGQMVSTRFNKVMVVVGKGALVENGSYTELLQNLKENGVNTVEVQPIDSNPHITSANYGADVCRRENVQAIIALGGGSTMDCAKIMAGVAAMNVDAAEFIWGENGTSQRPMEKSLPTVMIPTIASTGTELNNTAVMRDAIKCRKGSCANDAMYPWLTVMDPEYAKDLPPKVALWGAFDILSHTFEYYFNGDDSVYQMHFSEGIILTVMQLMEKLARDGWDPITYGELMWSAAMTWGTGLTKVGRGAPDMTCHTIEEVIGANLDTHHGAGLSILTPIWMEHIYKRAPRMFAQFSRNILEIRESDDLCCAKQGIQKFSNWTKSLGLPESFKEIYPGLLKDDAAANMTQEILSGLGEKNTVGKLVPLGAEEIQEILSKAFN